ncbi:hypothetical protein A4X13_0g6186 [Tilletia indica]|uniref:Extracellular membrane protein CFEM domain-containing protein n=1 Tax=Tilletia indica TaxID=43049 RepID=A0A8T8SPA7_9BASI|nr:hypothetical protein A4X13_0g6186 [Tilletia indica]
MKAFTPILLLAFTLSFAMTVNSVPVGEKFNPACSKSCREEARAARSRCEHDCSLDTGSCQCDKVFSDTLRSCELGC